jgi:hypothetical protein
VVPSDTTQRWVDLGTFLLTSDMACNSKGGVKFVHWFVILKGKQLATTIEVLVFCLSPSNESST